MSKKRNKTTALISCFLIALLMGFSGWIGFEKRGKKPLSTEKADSPQVISASDSKPEKTENDKDLLPVKETSVVKYIRVTSNTNILKKPSDSAKILHSLDTGYEARYIDEKDQFYKVRYDELNDGWIDKKKCELFEREIELIHAPKRIEGAPYSLKETKEGEDLGAILRKFKTVGASVAVIKDGKVSYRYEFGYADRENKISVTENTKFRVASLSKVFTAILAMAEVNDGKLDLDTNISDIFGYRVCHPKYAGTPITTRMLLTHSAGFSDKQGFYAPLSTVGVDGNYYSYKPGHRFLYSNLSIGIAGAVVEKTAGQTLSQYARDRFFAPMGIDASFYPDYLSDPSQIASCYFSGRLRCSREYLASNKENKKLEPGYVYYIGQSGLMISAVDLGKVATVLLNDGQYNGVSYLSRQTVDAMLTVHPVNTQNKYQQCIGIRKYTDLIGDRDMYYHTGNYYGIYALLAIDTSDRSGVVIITSGADSLREDNTIFGVCNDVMEYCYSELL